MVLVLALIKSFLFSWWRLPFPCTVFLFRVGWDPGFRWRGLEAPIAISGVWVATSSFRYRDMHTDVVKCLRNKNIWRVEGQVAIARNSELCSGISERVGVTSL